MSRKRILLRLKQEWVCRPQQKKTKEEIKPKVITKPTEASTSENTKPKEETSSKAEESQKEIYVGNQRLEVDPAEIERLVIEKVNAYRTAQGDTAATMLPGLTEVARYRANELTTNFEHRGEQQKIALARVFATKKLASVLILDEPSASLDVESEVLFHNNLFAETRDEIVITISHRLSTTKDSDVIFFLKMAN